MARSKGDEARKEAPVWVWVRRTCFAQYLPFCSKSDLLFVSLSPSLLLIAAFPHALCNALIWVHASDMKLELPQTELLLTSFLCFYACVCVFNCCRQQTVIPLSLPCVYVCVSPFFFLPGVGKCRTACLCVSVCVWEMFGGMPFDTERLLEMQFPPFLYMGVFMLGFIRIWKCCAAVPGLASPSVRSCSLALPFARSLASSVSPAGSCIRDEGLERRGRPTAYTGKLTITNRINTPRGSLKSVCVTG